MLYCFLIFFCLAFFTKTKAYRCHPDLNHVTCSPYNQTFCSDVIDSKMHVDQVCSHKMVDKSIESMLSLLKGVYKVDNGCIAAAKWTLCTVMFPGCTPSERLCQSACNLVKTKFCSKHWTAIERLKDVLFDKFPSPNCSALPSKKPCVFPQAMTDMITKEKGRIKVYIIAGACASVVLLIFIVLMSCALMRRKRAHINQLKAMTMGQIAEVHKTKPPLTGVKSVIGEVSPVYKSLGQLVKALGVPVMSREGLTFDQDLGEGAFGKVVRCKLFQKNNPRPLLVAVKTLKNDSSETEMFFRKEVEILSNFSHENVVPLLGVCLKPPGEMSIILEYMIHGDLNNYLRDRAGSYHAIADTRGSLPEGVLYTSPDLSFRSLLHVVRQIADGLDYLGKKRFVHRDVSARNVLVGENLKVKISDFGLAHDIYGSNYYRVDTQRMLPLRWLSPEALTLGRFTVASDVWAFGVTTWEVFTYGMQPFYGYSNEEVCQQIRCCKMLSRPYGCPPKVYELMQLCWKFNVRQRTTCQYAMETIDWWLSENKTWIDECWSKLSQPPQPPTSPLSKRLFKKSYRI